MTAGPRDRWLAVPADNPPITSMSSAITYLILIIFRIFLRPQPATGTPPSIIPPFRRGGGAGALRPLAAECGEAGTRVCSFVIPGSTRDDRPESDLRRKQGRGGYSSGPVTVSQARPASPLWTLWTLWTRFFQRPEATALDSLDSLDPLFPEAGAPALDSLDSLDPVFSQGWPAAPPFEAICNVPEGSRK